MDRHRRCWHTSYRRGDDESYALGHPSDWQLRADDTHDVGAPGSDHISDNAGYGCTARSAHR